MQNITAETKNSDIVRNHDAFGLTLDEAIALVSERHVRRYWVTLIEAAQSLGIQPATLRNQIRLGKLKADKRGTRDWHVTPREVERYRRVSRRNVDKPIDTVDASV